jgi:LysM repeat protein
VKTAGRWESASSRAVPQDGEGLGSLRVLTTFVLLVVAHLVAIWLLSSWKWVRESVPWDRFFGLARLRAAQLVPASGRPVSQSWLGEPDRGSLPRYRVGPGDTLVGIARRFGVEVQDLKKLNYLPNGRLRVGDTLVLPAGARWQKEVHGDGPRQSGPAWVEYTVRRGDTLRKIAHRNRTSVKALMRANGIEDPRKLQVGQVLRVPSKPALPPQGKAGAPSRAPSLGKPAAARKGGTQ